MTVYSLMWILNKTQNSGRLNNIIIIVITVTISTNRSKVFHQVAQLLPQTWLSLVGWAKFKCNTETAQDTELTQHAVRIMDGIVFFFLINS